jgi:5-methylcytosine-specific restriction endonuclease McrA
MLQREPQHDFEADSVTNSRLQLERVQGVTVSDDEILSDICRVSEQIGTNVVTQRTYSEYGKFDPKTASRHFGSWNKAIVAAGLEVANEVNISDERLFENLILLWEHFGRQPRIAELGRPPSTISWGAYRRRFRSWMDALSQFVEFANSQDMRPPSPNEAAAGHNTARNPSLRLRFRVMRRDHFSCRACGASPAVKLGVSLHVDHIEPWSRGGATTEDNLQTLCEVCNLGKSNVF